MGPYSRSLFIFRRDLRIEDNTALHAALTSSREVIACFILDPRQIKNNPYRGEPALAFMARALEGLAGVIRDRGGCLNILKGRPAAVLEQVCALQKIEAVFFNRDYTPFSVARDLALEKACQKLGVFCRSFDDALLCPPGSVMKASGGPYTVFTPFFRKACSLQIPAVKSLSSWSFSKKCLDISVPLSLASSEGGRGDAIRILNDISRFRRYDYEHDLPALEGTTRLSAHLKFGTVSVREVYHRVRKKLGREHPIIRQLYWRDFFTHIAYHFPHVFGGAFYPEYDTIPWKGTEAMFKAWCEGRTGFPIVDAGMRELNATGFMHNRARMITASFLVKDLHADWRRGERYFATRLRDYDPAVNNGNWQWVASTGCDHQPYFRVFNPRRQQERFDPDAVYIRRWVPELTGMSAEEIHGLSDGKTRVKGYPRPVISHSDAVLWTREVFREASRRGRQG
ncbi:MAG: deoxyribodipyrimidine photo-lyase [Elusimicrobia bacterium]|nr:deoxyribodipyrimidine photo-lyase [Elusimicrobiota bacterium]